MNELRVICHEGYRADEYPLAILLLGVRRAVTELISTWQDPEGRFFRVRCDDDQIYLLTCSRDDGIWSLE